MATLDALRGALIELDETLTLRLTEELASDGQTTPESIVSTCQQALKVVGERYEREEYFISASSWPASSSKRCSRSCSPPKSRCRETLRAARILLGTVAKDIHDIGKNLFAVVAEGRGFDVIDIGVDVPAERFLAETLRCRPDVVCLSGLISARSTA